jgi:chromosomal replication initiation ATPase DnaA
MHQSSVIHYPFKNLTPEQSLRARERQERIDRIARNAYQPVKKPAASMAEKVEVKNRNVEITACNGQVVVVTDDQLIAARNAFENAQMSINRIQRVVCNRFAVTQADLISCRRTKNLVIPRQVAMYLAKKLTLKSLPEIGRRFGDRDHTTVLYSVRKMAEQMIRDDALRQIVEDLSSILGEKVSYAVD